VLVDCGINPAGLEYGIVLPIATRSSLKCIYRGVVGVERRSSMLPSMSCSPPEISRKALRPRGQGVASVRSSWNSSAGTEELDLTDRSRLLCWPVFVSRDRIPPGLHHTSPSSPTSPLFVNTRANRLPGTRHSTCWRLPQHYPSPFPSLIISTHDQHRSSAFGSRFRICCHFGLPTT